jgi:hypothetical protein
LALVHGEQLTADEMPGLSIVVPIGPHGGAGQVAGRDELMGPDAVSQGKGQDLRTDFYAERFGVELPPTETEVASS